MENLYIICPKTIYQEYLDNVVSICKSKGYNVSYWKREEKYSPDNLRKSSIVVIIPETNLFEFNMNILPEGSFKEINSSINLRKKIYLAYTKNTGRIEIYETDTDMIKNNIIKGIIGRYLPYEERQSNNIPIMYL